MIRIAGEAVGTPAVLREAPHTTSCAAWTWSAPTASPTHRWRRRRGPRRWHRRDWASAGLRLVIEPAPGRCHEYGLTRPCWSRSALGGSAADGAVLSLVAAGHLAGVFSGVQVEYEELPPRLGAGRGAPADRRGGDSARPGADYSLVMPSGIRCWPPGHGPVWLRSWCHHQGTGVVRCTGPPARSVPRGFRFGADRSSVSRGNNCEGPGTGEGKQDWPQRPAADAAGVLQHGSIILGSRFEQQACRPAGWRSARAVRKLTAAICEQLTRRRVWRSGRTSGRRRAIARAMELRQSTNPTSGTASGNRRSAVGRRT